MEHALDAGQAARLAMEFAGRGFSAELEPRPTARLSWRTTLRFELVDEQLQVLVEFSFKLSIKLATGE